MRILFLIIAIFANNSLASNSWQKIFYSPGLKKIVGNSLDKNYIKKSATKYIKLVANNDRLKINREIAKNYEKFYEITKKRVKAGLMDRKLLKKSYNQYIKSLDNNKNIRKRMSFGRFEESLDDIFAMRELIKGSEIDKKLVAKKDQIYSLKDSYQVALDKYEQGKIKMLDLLKEERKLLFAKKDRIDIKEKHIIKLIKIYEK